MPADLNTFKGLILSLSEDKRVTVWHMAVVWAVLQLATKGPQAPVYISRKAVMRLAHINSFVTYHKCIKELQDYGYIAYLPSYHPGIRTQIRFLVDNKI